MSMNPKEALDIVIDAVYPSWEWKSRHADKFAEALSVLRALVEQPPTEPVWPRGGTVVYDDEVKRESSVAEVRKWAQKGYDDCCLKMKGRNIDDYYARRSGFFHELLSFIDGNWRDRTKR